MTVYKERVEELRKLMAEKNVDAYVIPTADFHASEYVGEHFKARAYVTGFSGSYGTAVIGKDDAGLWTDGRYFFQATNELEGSGVKLMKMFVDDTPSTTEWLAQNIKEGGKVAFDGRVLSMGEGQEYEEALAAKNIEIDYEEDFVDAIWTDRPALSEKPAFFLEEKYTGESVESKLARVRAKMDEVGATVHIITSLDDVCWLYNFRGDDIDFFPLVLSYTIVGKDYATLYVNEAKLDDAIKAELAKNNVEIRPYNDVYADAKKIGADEVALIDPMKMNYALYKCLECKKVEAANPTILMKAMKNPVEIANIRKAQIKDSVAHVRFMKWVKENVGKMTITEMSASDKLDEFRAEMGNFIRPSFEPISSFGPHAAIVHYTSSPETNVELEEGNFFLTDTGAGFYEGSTDITRTYALGEVPQFMKDDFTLVVISNLQLANAKFLEGTRGMVLDILARKPFWDRNLNFNHGTGHGVGYLLNIHEGPTGFRWTYRKGEIEAFREGMIITDEPGIYIGGSHGIRLENELLTCKGVQNEYGQFMYFEPITFVPMDLDAINPDMLNDENKQLLNDYHKKVFEVVSPYLNEEETAWLEKYTRAI